MNSRKNSNVSSKPRVSTESRDDLGKLYIVNRFYNVRCHGVRVRVMVILIIIF